MKKTLEISYRIAAVDSGSPIALLLALYDTLAGDLCRSADAIRSSDIELRCAQLSHAYLVLGQLESWLDTDRDSRLSKSLGTFYAYLRAKMLEASIKQAAAAIDVLVPLVLQIRSSWQQRQAELQALHVTPESAAQRSYSSTNISSANVGLALSQTA